MIAAGEVRPDAPGHAARVMEWLLIGALVKTAAKPHERRGIERSVVELVLRVLGFAPERIAALVEGLDTVEPAATRRATG